MRAYQRGETIRLAFDTKITRISEHTGRAYVTVPGSLGGEDSPIEIDLSDYRLTIDRVLPADGAPRAGDVWRDANGDLWFGQQPNYQAPVVLVPANRKTTAEDRRHIEDAQAEVGPMTLVWRETASP